MTYRAVVPTGRVLHILENRDQLLGLVSLVLVFIIPIAALPLAIYALRESRRTGASNVLAEWGRNGSIFVMAVLTLFVVIGFTASVIVPLMST